jgi:predicted peptidase
MNKIVLYSLLGVLLTLSSYAQVNSSYEKGKHLYKEGELNFRVLYPPDFDEKRKYPFILFLHGAGERGSDNEKQLVHGGRLFAADSNRTKFQYIVIFPQCPREDYWASVDVTFDENGKRDFKYVSTREPTNALKGVISLVDSVSKLPFVNKEKMFVGGLSMGGMGTTDLLSRRPGTFKAGFVICGGGDPETVKRYARKTDLWFFHGAKDDVVPPEDSEKLYESIKSQNKEVKYTLFPDANHNSWDAAFSQPALLPWLFSH